MSPFDEARKNPRLVLVFTVLLILIAVLFTILV